MRFLFLSLVLITSPNLFAKVICSAFCVTISDRPEIRTKNAYKIHFSNQVNGITSAEVEKRCPKSPLLGTKTMLLLSYTPFQLKMGMSALPGDYLNIKQNIEATKENVCREIESVLVPGGTN